MQDEKLSALEKRILLDVAQGEITGERTRRGKWGASDRAVFSRALARLESRGLVVIEHKRGRTPRTALTQDGQEIVEDLRGDNLPSIAELEVQREEIQHAYARQIEDAYKRLSTYRLERLLARSFPGVPLNWHAVALTMQGKYFRARRTNGARLLASLLSEHTRQRAPA